MPTAQNGPIGLSYDVDGKGADLLLISGSASTRAIWTLVRPRLAQRFRTIAFDNRDSGESTIVREPYCAKDLAEDALAVLDAAGSSALTCWGTRWAESSRKSRFRARAPSEDSYAGLDVGARRCLCEQRDAAAGQPYHECR